MFRAQPQRDASSVSAAMLCLAVMFPLYFLLANLLARLSWMSIGARLMLGAAVTAALFALLPLAFALMQRISLREAFRLRRAPWAAFVAAALLGLSLWPIAHEIFLLNRVLGLSVLSQERIEAARQLLESWRGLSTIWILLALAVTPAVCEEFFFRGYLFTALARRCRPLTTICATAILFGVFHVVVTSMLSVERLLPSTFLGLMLGWVCWRTGSVLPGMLLHACHNGLLLTIACYREALMERGWGIAEQSHLPATWLTASVICIAAALVLLQLTTRKT
jgi:ABC-2 type transport system permease protein/sodium transport system permease protein